MAEPTLKILVLQGPNLNLLGTREPEVYGSFTLDDVHADLEKEGRTLGVELEFLQSNHEGELIDAVQAAPGKGIQGIIINAASYTHTSIGLRDALAGVGLPYIEIHISNVYRREEFRRHSYLSADAAGVVVGFGVDGYRLSLHGLARKLREA